MRRFSRVGEFARVVQLAQLVRISKGFQILPSQPLDYFRFLPMLCDFRDQQLVNYELHPPTPTALYPHHGWVNHRQMVKENDKRRILLNDNQRLGTHCSGDRSMRYA